MRSLHRRQRQLLFTISLILTLWALDRYICPEKEGVILIPLGGLGNQLFEYACAYALAKQIRAPLYMEVSEEPENEASVHYNSKERPFVLHKFHRLRVSEKFSWAKSRILSLLHSWRLDDATLYALYENPSKIENLASRLITINDYCQSEYFFKDYKDGIKKMFQPSLSSKEEEQVEFGNWKNLIQKADDASVFLHVRRGDYVGFGEAWLTPFKYYHEAAQLLWKKLEKRLTIFVFSDTPDLIMVEDFLKGFPSTTMDLHFVSCQTNRSKSECLNTFQEFSLMTNCRHAIISYSTFSWWAAYLIGNENKTVIAPVPNEKAFGTYANEEITKFKKFEESIFYPKDWTVLNPYNKFK